MLVVAIPDQTADDRSTWCGTRIGGDRTAGDGRQWVDYPGLGFSADSVAAAAATGGDAWKAAAELDLGEGVVEGRDGWGGLDGLAGESHGLSQVAAARDEDHGEVILGRGEGGLGLQGFAVEFLGFGQVAGQAPAATITIMSSWKIAAVQMDCQLGAKDANLAAIRAHDGSWERSQMARLAGKFAGINYHIDQGLLFRGKVFPDIRYFIWPFLITGIGGCGHDRPPESGN